MPSEITTIKYKFEQQFAQSDKWLIWRGGVLMESIAFYDYKSNESLLKKFWKIQKCIKKKNKNLNSQDLI